MTKAIALALATAGAVWFGAAQASATAASPEAGLQTVSHNAAVADDMSARRRGRRAARVYYYPRYQNMYPYGYYGPMSYDRPYVRPAPLWFGVGGWW
jgi:hypothetical protein